MPTRGSDPGEWSPLGSGLLIQDNLGGSVFQLWILLGVLQGEVPLLMKPSVVINANALSRWTPPHLTGEDLPTTGLVGGPWWQKSRVSQWKTKHT